MYRLGRRTHKKHLIAVAVLVCLVLIAAGTLMYRGLNLTTAPQGSINNSPGVVTHYAASDNDTVKVDEEMFSVELPKQWKATTAPSNVMQTPYYFTSPSVEARQLAIYIDTLPLTLGVNRVVIVSSQGATLDHGMVSDNCSGYTPPQNTNPTSTAVAAKWQDVDFLCDVGNFSRNVIGITSREGVNKVTLTGPTTGAHAVFMTYTDNGSSPDVTIFYNILSSLKFK